MEARGWDRDRLAREMCIDVRDYGLTRLALDFYFDVGSTNPNLRMGEDSARQFARAFGVSTELFLELEQSWLASVESAKSVPGKEKDDAGEAWTDR